MPKNFSTRIMHILQGEIFFKIEIVKSCKGFDWWNMYFNIVFNYGHICKQKLVINQKSFWS